MNIPRVATLLGLSVMLTVLGASLTLRPPAAAYGQEDPFSSISAELDKAKKEYDGGGIPQAIARLKPLIPRIQQLPAEQRRVIEAEALFYYGAGLAAMNKTAEAVDVFVKMFLADEAYKVPNKGPKINSPVEQARAKWRQDAGGTVPAPVSPPTEVAEPAAPIAERIKAAIDAIWAKVEAGESVEGTPKELEKLHSDTLKVVDESRRNELQAEIWDLRGKICTKLSDFEGAAEYYNRMLLTDRSYALSAMAHRHDAQFSVLADYAEKKQNGQDASYAISLSLDPAQAEVAIDSGSFQPNPKNIPLKKPFFEIRLRARGYKPMARNELVVSPGQLFSYHLDEDGLEYTFETSPPGATVTIGDTRLEKTTPCSSLLKFKTQTVRMELDGYAPWTETVEPKPGQEPMLLSRSLIPSKYTVSGQFKPVKDANIDYPFGLTLSKRGYFYVLDTQGRNFIRRFTPDLIFQKEVGKDTSVFQALAQPADIAVDSKENIYLCDTMKRAIFRFDTLAQAIAVKYVGSGSGDAGLYGPLGLAFDSRDNLYVADTVSDNDKSHGRIVVFGPDRNLKAVWPRPGEAPLKPFKGVAVNSKDEILAITTDSVIVWSKEGAILRSWGNAGSGPGNFKGLLKIRVDDEDCVYVVDSGNRSIQKFDENGRFIGVVCDYQNGGIKAPRDIAFDSQGRVFVIDSLQRAIYIFTGPGAAK